MIFLLLLFLSVLGRVLSAPAAEPAYTKPTPSTWTAQHHIPTPSSHHGISIPVIHHTWPSASHPTYTAKPTMDPIFPSLTHSSGWGFPTLGSGNETPKKARNALRTTDPTSIPTTAALVSSSTTATTNEFPVPAHTGVPDCNFQGVPSTGILNYLIHENYAPDAWSCQEACEEWLGCQSYSYRVPANTDFPNCELFSVKFDGVDPATGIALVIKWLVPLMWYSNSRPSDGSGFCYAKP